MSAAGLAAMAAAELGILLYVAQKQPLADYFRRNIITIRRMHIYPSVDFVMVLAVHIYN